MAVNPSVLATQLRNIADALTMIANEIDMDTNKRAIVDRQTNVEAPKGVLSVQKMA